VKEEKLKKVKGEKMTKRAGVVVVVEIASNRGMPWEQVLASEVHLRWRLTPSIDY